MPISKHNRVERGDFAANCDDCDVLWLRSELEKKGDGLLYCPDCIDGRDAVTLNLLNEQAAHQLQPAPRVYSGGSFHTDDHSGNQDVAEVVGGVTFGRQGFGGG
jgi:hypothetical protein